MRKSVIILALGVLALMLSVGPAMVQTYVDGYYRSDGTYVQPHYRSSPNRSYNDNWSVSPNTNPYTGKRGTRSPTLNDRPPSNPYGLPSYRKRTISPYGKR